MKDLARLEKRKQAKLAKRTDHTKPAEQADTFLDTHGTHIVTHNNVRLVHFDNQLYALQTSWHCLGWLHWCRHKQTHAKRNMCRACSQERWAWPDTLKFQQFVILVLLSGLLVVDTASLCMTHVFVLARSPSQADCKTIVCKDHYYTVDHIFSNSFAAFHRCQFLCVFSLDSQQSLILYDVLAWHSIRLTSRKCLLCVCIEKSLRFYSLDDNAGCKYVADFDCNQPKQQAWLPRFVHSTGCQATCELDAFVNVSVNYAGRIVAKNVKTLVVDLVRKVVLQV